MSIDNAGKELKANMTANAEIVLEQFPNSLLVPEAAIVFDAKRNASVERRGPRRADRAAARCLSRSASATARGSRSSTASRRATKSCYRARCECQRGCSS